MSSTTTTWSTDTNTKSGSATTFTDTVSSLRLVGGEGEDAILRLFADEGDDNADQWRIVSQASTNKLNIMSFASGSWSNVLNMFGSGTAASQYIAIQAGNKLYLDGAGGTTYLQESSDGHLEINVGTTLDLTAPTVDINSSTELNIDTVLYDLNASGAVTIDSAGVSIDSSAASNLTTSSGALTITSAAAATWSTSAGALSISGATEIDLASVIIDINATTTCTIDNTNTSNGVVINAATSGGPVSIGHTTSETTVNDNLTVTGNVGIGTANPLSTSPAATVGMEIMNTAGDGANQGGYLRLASNHSIMTAGDRLGILEFAGAEDGGSTIVPGARVQCTSTVDWAGDENSANLSFWTCDANANITEKMTILDIGNVGIGTTAPDYALSLNQDGAVCALSIDCHDDAYSNRPMLLFRKADGTEADPDKVADDDILGQISFQGWDADSSGEFVDGAYIKALVSGTPGDDDMPTELSFWTSADGSNSPTQRMTIMPTGNVGIGVTDPDNPLEVNGYVQIDALNTSLKLKSGTTANGIQLINTGSKASMYLTGQTLQFFIDDTADATEGSNFVAADAVLNIDGANQRVGIGTSAPEYDLQIGAGAVPSTLAFGDDSSNQQSKILFISSDSNKNFALAYNFNVAGGFEITRSTAAGGETFTTPDFTVNSSGFVGIGNTAPGSLLEVSKVSGDATLELSTWSASDTDSGTLIFQKSSIATLNTFGDGAGTAAAETLGRIEAWGTTQDNTAADDVAKLSSYIEFANDGASREGGVPGKIVFATASNGDDANAQPRVTITDDGNVGIGETTPGGRLEVDNPNNVDQPALLIDQSDTTNNPYAISILNSSTGDSIHDDSGAKLTYDGTFTNAPSTYAKKENIQEEEIGGYIDKINTLKLFTFQKKREIYGYKESGEKIWEDAPRYLGYILDDDSTPEELISRDRDGNIDGLVADRGVAFLLAVCKELTAKVEALENNNE